jgi:hypothetical protein
MLDDPDALGTIDLIALLLRQLDNAKKAGTMLGVGLLALDEGAELLAAARLDWRDVAAMVRLGAETLLRSKRADDLAWSVGPDWQTSVDPDGASRGRLTVDHYHADFGWCASVRECRGGCPCHPKHGHPKRWHTCHLISPGDTPIPAWDGGPCYGSKLAAQIAMRDEAQSWPDPPDYFNTPEPPDAPEPPEGV